MAREFAKDFYNSPLWRKTAKLYKQSKFGICERCKRPHSKTIVHHKIHLTPDNINDYEVSLNFGNLELLCIDCHNTEHFQKYSMTRDDVCFNERGELVKRVASREAIDTPLL